MINTACLHLHIESRVNEKGNGTISGTEGDKEEMDQEKVV